MPELPDITAYIEALVPRVQGQPLEQIRIKSPFALRTVEPPLQEAEGRKVVGIRRLGKRIVLALEDELFLIIHLMIAGRLQWRATSKDGNATLRSKLTAGKITLAALEFPTGALRLTEAGTKKRASLHFVLGEAEMRKHHAGGLEVLECDEIEFVRALRRENHTLKRSLTDPRLFSGIGNAYSDEILHAARISPLKLSQSLTDSEASTLFDATRDTLQHWITKLRDQFAGRFPGPGQITAFHEGMTVHGRYGKPCPVCGTPIQRIRYSENETNYCARCQTEGRVLADRSLSRLLKDDWPRSIEEL